MTFTTNLEFCTSNKWCAKAYTHQSWTSYRLWQNCAPGWGILLKCRLRRF